VSLSKRLRFGRIIGGSRSSSIKISLSISSSSLYFINSSRRRLASFNRLSSIEGGVLLAFYVFIASSSLRTRSLSIGFSLDSISTV
jgi:hypothetical protein